MPQPRVTIATTKANQAGLRRFSTFPIPRSSNIHLAPGLPRAQSISIGALRRARPRHRAEGFRPQPRPCSCWAFPPRIRQCVASRVGRQIHRHPSIHAGFHLEPDCTSVSSHRRGRIPAAMDTLSAVGGRSERFVALLQDLNPLIQGVPQFHWSAGDEGLVGLSPARLNEDRTHRLAGASRLPTLWAFNLQAAIALRFTRANAYRTCRQGLHG